MGSSFASLISGFPQLVEARFVCGPYVVTSLNRPPIFEWCYGTPVQYTKYDI